MAQISRSVTIRRPRRVVFEAWSDFLSFPEFLSDVESVERLTDDRTRWKVTVGGQTLVFEALVTEVQPDLRMAWTSTGGDVDHAGSVEFGTGEEDATEVSVLIDWEPSGLGERLGSIVGVPGVAIQRQLDQFKQHVEQTL